MVLLVEDSSALANPIVERLRGDGFAIDVADSARAAIDRLAIGDIEAVVVDLELPGTGGIAVIDFMRARELAAPLLAIAAADDVAARVGALDRGADDVIVKPFEYVELAARLRALLRRSAAPRWAPLSCNGLVLRSNDLVVTLGTERVALSPREHELLGLLLRRQGETVTRAEIVRHLFPGGDVLGGTNVVNVHVANLRRKLGSQLVVIEPVRTLGYRLLRAS